MNIRKKYAHLYNTGAWSSYQRESIPPYLLTAFFIKYLLLTDNFWAMMWFWLSMLSVPQHRFYFPELLMSSVATFWLPINFTGTLEDTCNLRAPLQRGCKRQQNEILSEVASSTVLVMHSEPQHTDISVVNWKTQVPHLRKFSMTLTSSCSWQVSVTKENFLLKMITVLNSFSVGH